MLFTRSLLAALLVATTLVVAPLNGVAQSPAPSGGDAAKTEKAPEAATKSDEAPKAEGKIDKAGLKGRQLPPHFGKVIDGIQREKIYQIQEDTYAKIKALQDEIEKLRQERDEKVRAVLTPEQLERVKQYEQEAAKK